MRREDAKTLLNHIRELAKEDAVIDTFIRLADIEANAELDGSQDKEFIDEVIINKLLLNMLSQLITVQSAISKESEEVIKNQANAINSQYKKIQELLSEIETLKSKGGC